MKEKILFVSTSDICFLQILFLNIILRHSPLFFKILLICLCVIVTWVSPISHKGYIYYDSEFSRIHLPFCFSGNGKHLTLGYVSMSKALLFKLHFLIVSLKFCWFEIHRRNFRSIKDLFNLKIKAIIKVIRNILKK